MSRVLRFVKNMASFTKAHRAAMRRRGGALGKRTLIYNELPRSAGRDGEVTINDFKVRADFFGGMARGRS